MEKEASVARRSTQEDFLSPVGQISGGIQTNLTEASPPDILETEIPQKRPQKKFNSALISSNIKWPSLEIFSPVNENYTEGGFSNSAQVTRQMNSQSRSLAQESSDFESVASSISDLLDNPMLEANSPQLIVSPRTNGVAQQAYSPQQVFSVGSLSEAQNKITPQTKLLNEAHLSLNETHLPGNQASQFSSKDRFGLPKQSSRSPLPTLDINPLEKDINSINFATKIMNWDFLEDSGETPFLEPSCTQKKRNSLGFPIVYVNESEAKCFITEILQSGINPAHPVHQNFLPAFKRMKVSPVANLFQGSRAEADLLHIVINTRDMISQQNSTNFFNGFRPPKNQHSLDSSDLTSCGLQFYENSPSFLRCKTILNSLRTTTNPWTTINSLSQQ